MENTRAVLMEELRQEIHRAVSVEVVDFDRDTNAYDLIKELKQELFNYLSNELGATALDGQLDDIINICNRLNNK